MLAEIVASVILGFRFSPDFNGDWKVDIEDLVSIEVLHTVKQGEFLARRPARFYL